jgi:pyridoxamine 5'-phosphate oxidase-like protein
MGKVFAGIDDRLAEWIGRQRVFFVGTAPRDGGHVNVSPKGPIESLRIVDRHTIEYDDHVGSGAETIAHLRDDGRICVMLCAFDGPPRIVRLHGRGEVLVDPDPGRAGVRGVVRVHVDRVSDSCGYGVPLMDRVGDRPQQALWVERKLAQGGVGALAAYRARHNVRSIDDLPALDA